MYQQQYWITPLYLPRWIFFIPKPSFFIFRAFISNVFFHSARTASSEKAHVLINFASHLAFKDELWTDQIRLWSTPSLFPQLNFLFSFHIRRHVCASHYHLISHHVSNSQFNYSLTSNLFNLIINEENNGKNISHIPPARRVPIHLRFVPVPPLKSFFC